MPISNRRGCCTSRQNSGEIAINGFPDRNAQEKRV